MWVNTTGSIEQDRQDCVQSNGYSYDECTRIVNAQISEDFNRSRRELSEASADLRRTLGAN